jgi:hypothetical protein
MRSGDCQFAKGYGTLSQTIDRGKQVQDLKKTVIGLCILIATGAGAPFSFLPLKLAVVALSPVMIWVDAQVDQNSPTDLFVSLLVGHAAVIIVGIACPPVGPARLEMGAASLVRRRSDVIGEPKGERDDGQRRVGIAAGGKD